MNNKRKTVEYDQQGILQKRKLRDLDSNYKEKETRKAYHVHPLLS